MKNLKFIAISILLLTLLDYVWLALLMKDFYLGGLSHLGRIESGQFQPILSAAFVVYFLLSIGLIVICLPRSKSKMDAFIQGGFFGLIVYGVYEFTNLSLLRDWPLSIVIADCLWGLFLCGTVNSFLFYLNNLSKN